MIWCERSLGDSAELDQEHGDGTQNSNTFNFESIKLKRIRQENTVPVLIEFAVAAIWGCAAVICHNGAYDLLKDSVEKWVPILLKISNLSDDRVNGAVPVAASNAMALLAVGLTSEFLTKFPNLLFDYMEIVETGAEMDTREAASSTISAMCQFGTGSSDRYRTMNETGAVEVAPTREFLNRHGTERLCAVIVNENTRTLDRCAGTAVMHLCGLPGVRTRSQIKAVVSVLTCHDKPVVHSICIGIWLLAHDAKVRLVPPPLRPCHAILPPHHPATPPPRHSITHQRIAVCWGTSG